MGHKVNPRAFRTNTTFHFPSRWFASPQKFSEYLRSDIEVRCFIRKICRDSGVAQIDIERAPEEIRITIHTSKPGMVIGRGGSLIEEMRKKIKRIFFGSIKMKVVINIQEVSEPDITAEIVHQHIREQLEKRIPFRRALKRSMEQVMRGGAKGCRLQVSGRLNGAEIARTETLSKGRLPLHTIRADIDYTRGVARTIYGAIGIKVWIYKGEVFGEKVEEPVKPVASPRRPQRRSTAPRGGATLRKKRDIETSHVSLNTQKPLSAAIAL